MSSNILQTAMVFAASVMQYFRGSRGKGLFALGAIALLAFPIRCSSRNSESNADARDHDRNGNGSMDGSCYFVELIAGSFVGSFCMGESVPLLRC